MHFQVSAKGIKPWFKQTTDLMADHSSLRVEYAKLWDNCWEEKYILLSKSNVVKNFLSGSLHIFGTYIYGGIDLEILWFPPTLQGFENNDQGFEINSDTDCMGANGVISMN